MSNIDTVNAMYAAFGEGNIPFIVDQLADDIRWEDGAPDHGIPWLKPGQGKDHVMGFFGALASFDFKTFDIQRVLGDGDMVVGVLQVAAVDQESGKAFDNLEIHVWRFRPDGKVASFNHVLDTYQHLLVARD